MKSHVTEGTFEREDSMREEGVETVIEIRVVLFWSCRDDCTAPWQTWKDDLFLRVSLRGFRGQVLYGESRGE